MAKIYVVDASNLFPASETNIDNQNDITLEMVVSISHK